MEDYRKIASFKVLEVPFIQDTTDKLEKLIDDRYNSLEKLIGSRYDTFEKTLEKTIENKITRKFNYVMLILGITLPAFIGLTMGVFFYLQGEIFTTNIELAKLSTNFNYFVNPPTAESIIPTVNATVIP